MLEVIGAMLGGELEVGAGGEREAEVEGDVGGDVQDEGKGRGCVKHQKHTIHKACFWCMRQRGRRGRTKHQNTSRMVCFGVRDIQKMHCTLQTHPCGGVCGV